LAQLFIDYAREVADAKRQKVLDRRSAEAVGLNPTSIATVDDLGKARDAALWHAPQPT
jgi:hypothetical protein